MVFKYSRKFLLILSFLILLMLLVTASFLYPKNGDARLFSPFFSWFFRIGATLTFLSGVFSFQKLTNRSKTILYFSLLTCLLIVQILFLIFFQRPLHTDTAYVFTMAERLASNNHNWFYYFTLYPNNVNITIFWSWIISFFKFVGIQNYLAAYPWFQAVVLDLSCYFFAYSLNDIRRGMGRYALLFAFAYLPLFMYVIFPYNDVFAVSLLLVSLGSLIKAMKCEETNYKFAWYGLSFLALAVGIAIRQNLLIILIAFIVMIFLSRQYSVARKFILTISSVVITIVVMMFFHASTINQQFHSDDNHATPSMRYINMSWNPETSGEINVADAWEGGQLSKSARTELLTHEFENRLKELGPFGILKHIVKKISYMFAIGLPYQDMEDVKFSDMLPISQSKTRPLYAFVANIFQPVYLFFLFISSYAVLKCKTKKYDNITTDLIVLSSLAIVGVTAFHALLWEVRDRYALPLVPFFILLSTLAIVDIKIPNQRRIAKFEKMSKYVNVVALSLLLVGFGSQFTHFNSLSNQSGLVYSSGFDLYAEPTNDQKIINSDESYRSAKFKLNSQANGVLFSNTVSSELQPANFELINARTLESEKVNVKPGWSFFNKTVEKGLYFVIINTNDIKKTPSTLIEQTGVNDVQGPALHESDKFVPDMRAVFDIKDSQEQKIMPFFLYAGVYMIFIILLCLTLLVKRNKR
ncbi:hypothetical protein OZX65_02490 [Leuconostocaceae bacterium ESL0723]|nr:hypothetical protein OZX65_02490 [Leuconostocaceae bacterium ESL0723]